jgi:hypothetical protein
MYLKVLSVAVLICAVGMVTGSCSDADPSARNKPGDAGQLDLSKAKSWNGGIDDLFLQKCGNCHPGVKPTNYKTYAGVKGNISAGSQSVQARINDNTMPPGGLGDVLKATVNDWIAAGAPESDSASGTPSK